MIRGGKSIGINGDGVEEWSYLPEPELSRWQQNTLQNSLYTAERQTDSAV